MDLIPIKETLEENEQFNNDPLCRQTINLTIDFYKKVGFVPPWIGYYAEEQGRLVGSAGFKGPPKGGIVEIAYGTMEDCRNQGIGNTICRRLVDISLREDPSVKITARTFSENDFSSRILIKNNFRCLGAILDPEDGQVWEWLYKETPE